MNTYQVELTALLLDTDGTPVKLPGALYVHANSVENACSQVDNLLKRDTLRMTGDSSRIIVYRTSQILGYQLTAIDATESMLEAIRVALAKKQAGEKKQTDE